MVRGKRGVSINIVAVLIAALVIGIVIGYGVLQLTVKPETVTTTITKSETLTESKILTTPLPTTITETKTITELETKTTTVTRTLKPEKKALFDVLGRKIELAKIPKRVVSLAPSITEILFALGVGDRVVGVDSFSNYPPKVVELVKEGKIKVVGGYWAPDLEKVVELNPDLVIADLGAHYKYLAKFEELGLNVLFVKGGNAVNLIDIYNDILLIGEALNATDKAYEIVTKIKEMISSISDKLAKVNVTQRKVLILLGPPTYGLWTTGSGTFIDELIRICGGINIASKYHGWIQISKEEILVQNPDIIIVTVMGTKEDAVKVIEEIMSPEMGLDVNAVKNKEIYVLIGEADDLLCRPGPRVAEAVKMLASIIHPEVFGEVGREDVVSAKQLS